MTLFSSLTLLEFLHVFSRIYPLLEIKDEVSPRFELAKVVELFDRSDDILIFARLKDYPSFVGVSNLLNTRKKLWNLLEVSSDIELYKKILEAEELAQRTPVVEYVSSHDFRIIEKPDLTQLPFALFYEREPRPYITSGIVAASDTASGYVNLSIHRLSLLDRNKLVIRVVPRHLYALWCRACQEGRDLPVAIYLGVNPVVHLAAACSPPFGVSELGMIYYLSGVKPRVFTDPDFGVPILVDADIVLVGRMSCSETAEEGPYVDVLRLYDEVRPQPVVKVEKMYVRSDLERHFMYYIVPALSEHRLLMSIEKEAKIWKFVSNVVPEVVAVRLTPGSGSWLHAVIAIKKQTDGDAKNAILAAFAAHPSLKHVVVVDADVDIDNPEEIEWAIATRFRGDEDLVVIEYVRGSTLDPSAIDRESGLTVKIGIDATRPLSRPCVKFEKARIPVSLRSIHAEHIDADKLREILSER